MPPKIPPKNPNVMPVTKLSRPDERRSRSAFIVTEQAKKSMLGIGATGAAFDDVEVTVTDQFKELYPSRKLPPIAWLKPEGRAGQDDIGAAADGRLVVPQRALDTLNGLGLSNALVEPFGCEGA